MDGYVQVSLNEMMKELGEDGVKPILSTFSCPLNLDVERFLKRSAMEFAKQSIAQTHLVFTSFQGKLELVGYFTLAYKFFYYGKGVISGTLKKKINKFGTYDKIRDGYTIPAPLIAQLGKNFAHGYNQLISGDELLWMAIQKVATVQQNVGGKVIYLECEEKEPLLRFYESNGFVVFGKRELDRDETALMDGKYFMQMLKVMK